MAMEQRINERQTRQKRPPKPRPQKIVSKHAAKWYRYSQNADDSTTRFFLLWIAFNWLYNGEDYFYNGEGELIESDRGRIRELVGKEHSKLKDFNPFRLEEFKILAESPIIDELSDTEQEKDYADINSKNRIKRIKGLFMTLYQIRCNLFHGSKRLDVERDEKLIRSAAVILDGYLQTILDLENGSSNTVV